MKRQVELLGLRLEGDQLRSMRRIAGSPKDGDPRHFRYRLLEESEARGRERRSQHGLEEPVPDRVAQPLGELGPVEDVPVVPLRIGHEPSQLFRIPVTQREDGKLHSDPPRLGGVAPVGV